MFQCSQCSKKFKYESEKKRHELSHITQFECDVCLQKFGFVSALKRHQLQHKRKDKVTCKNCNRSFKDEVLLQRHTKYAHNGKYTCATCSAVFNSDLALKIHMKIHKPKSERKFKCNYDGCNKSFNFSHHFKHHKLTHLKEKPYYCVICGKGFIQPHHFKTHLKTHDPEALLKCAVPHCAKTFSNDYAMKRHQATHSKPRKTKNIQTKIITKGKTSSASHKIAVPRKEKAVINSSIKNKNNNICDTKNRTNFDIDNMIKSKNYYESIKEEFEFVEDCKSALGACLVNETSNNEGCLCSQINDTALKNQPDVAVSSVYSTDKCNTVALVEKTKTVSAVCDPKINDVYKIEELRDVCIMPRIEYKVDGTVKLGETFDLDLREIKENHAESLNVQNTITFVPYNSCKAVLGNCIVSEDGSMGEGCLCAKMFIEEQQMSSQEMEEITPQPIK